MKILPVIYQPEIRFNDIDVMGHVNNAIYLNYFEQARMKWFEAIAGKDWDWFSFGVLLARNEVNYREPVRLTDEIYTEVWCGKTGTKSFDLHYEVYTVKNGVRHIKTEGISVLVCYDYHKKQSIGIPESWKKILAGG